MFNKLEIAELKLNINNLESWINFFIKEATNLDKKIDSISKIINELSARVEKLEKE